MAKTQKYADDPIENLVMWIQANQKSVLTGAVVVAVSVAAVYGYRWMDHNKRVSANSELYKATVPMMEGQLPAAQTALENVVRRFGGTTSGAQAALLLGQVMYDQQKFADGIAMLDKAKGSAGSDFAASFESLMASGYEAEGKFDVAAEHYAKAANAAKFPIDKAANQANQARSLTEAGKLAEARPLWEELAKQEEFPYAQEAQVRLGEIIGAGK